MRNAAHLFFDVFGLWLDLRAEAIDLLSDPLADSSHLIRMQLLQVLIAEVHARAFPLALFQELADTARDGKQNSMIPAAQASL